MHRAVRDITRGAHRACKSEAEKHHRTVLDTSAILDTCWARPCQCDAAVVLRPRERALSRRTLVAWCLRVPSQHVPRGPKSRFRVVFRNMLFQLACVCDDAGVSFPIFTVSLQSLRFHSSPAWRILFTGCFHCFVLVFLSWAGYSAWNTRPKS